MIKTLAANINNNILGVAFNDLYIDENGNIAVSYDINAVLEQCSQVAKVLLGELIFNTTLGVPYFETIWTGTPNAMQFEASLRQSFLNVNGVIEVVTLTTSQGDNTQSGIFRYTATIRTIFGTGVLNG